MDVIFSQSVIVLASHPDVEFHGDFVLKMHFDINKKESDKGEVIPQVKAKIKDGLNLTLTNFFHVDSGVNDGYKTQFFKKTLKKEGSDPKDVFYHLFFSTQSLSENNDSILLTVNIATTEDKIDLDED
jgi:hypothetical protein